MEVYAVARLLEKEHNPLSAIQMALSGPVYDEPGE
jgi:hypothetical protein